MSQSAPVRMTPPNFRTSRLVGIFNVLFASQILLCGLCMSGYTMTLPLWGRVFAQAQKQSEAQGERLRTAQLEGAIEQEKAAKTDQEKIEAAARRMEIEKRPKSTIPVMVDFTKMGFTDPKLLAWSWTELATSLVLNVMMLVAGVGLMNWKSWARPLGIWTAVLKIVRLVLVYGFFTLTIAPLLAQKMGEVVVAMIALQPGMMGGGGAPPPQAMFVKIYLIQFSVMGLGIIILGVIYPAIVIWLLTRPGVKFACSGRLKLPMEPKQPW